MQTCNEVFSRCANFFWLLFSTIMNSIRNFTRVSIFLNFHKTKQYKHVMRSYDFYNLSEFAFEHLRNSRRTSAPLKSLFFSNCFSQHDCTVTSILLALLLPPCSHCFFFFDTTNWYEVFLACPKSHNLRTETKCCKLSPEGFCEIPPQKQS